jgi:hypothetical protein
MTFALPSHQKHLEDLLANVFIPERINAALRDRRDLIATFVIGPEGEQPGYTFVQNPKSFDEALFGESGLMAAVTRQTELARATLDDNP